MTLVILVVRITYYDGVRNVTRRCIGIAGARFRIGLYCQFFATYTWFLRCEIVPNLRFDSEAHRFIFVKEEFIAFIRRPKPVVPIVTKSTKYEVSKMK